MSVTKPYPFTPEFERSMAVAACCRPGLYGRGLNRLDPDAITDETSKWILAACRSISQDTGSGPDSTTVVLQRLRLLMDKGKVTQHTFDACQDAMVEELDRLPSDESILAEVLPALKRRLRKHVLIDATADLADDKKSFDKTIDALNEIEAIGAIDQIETGTALGDKAFAEIAGLKDLQYLPLGIPELDMILSGGLWRGAQGVFIGGSGAGKSQGLCHVAAEAWGLGFFVGIVTLEISRPIWMSRLIAACTGVPINDITGGYGIAEAKQKLAAAKHTGLAVITEMPATVTSVTDITQWVERVEKEHNRKMDVLVVDYIDRVGAKKKGGSSSSYQVGLETTEGLRLFCQKRSMWNWTASQSTRGQKGGKKVKDLDDVADSMHKVRVPDLIITLNMDDDGMGNSNLNLFIAKNRLGISQKLVGPFTPAFEVGRLVR